MVTRGVLGFYAYAPLVRALQTSKLAGSGYRASASIRVVVLMRNALLIHRVP
jgi:hypothetical protein